MKFPVGEHSWKFPFRCWVRCSLDGNLPGNPRNCSKFVKRLLFCHFLNSFRWSSGTCLQVHWGWVDTLLSLFAVSWFAKKHSFPSYFNPRSLGDVAIFLQRFRSGVWGGLYSTHDHTETHIDRQGFWIRTQWLGTRQLRSRWLRGWQRNQADIVEIPMTEWLVTKWNPQQGIGIGWYRYRFCFLVIFG